MLNAFASEIYLFLLLWHSMKSDLDSFCLIVLTDIMSNQSAQICSKTEPNYNDINIDNTFEFQMYA